MNTASLFQPLKVNSLMLPNRIISAPMNEALTVKRVRCGAGILIAGCGGVDLPNAWFDPGYLFSKEQVQKTREWLNFMRQGGSAVSLEVMHMGGVGRAARPQDVLWGSSDGVNAYGNRVKAMTKAEMDQTAAAFAKTCKDAKELGFDLVMLHFAHGWLPAQFLSPALNHRQDEFGGSLENRMRFPLAIVKAVREAVGPDYPVDLRISAKEWIPDGMELDEVLTFLKQAEPYLDMVNISAGLDMDKRGNIHMATSALEPHAVNRQLARSVKQTLSIPVALVGAIMTPQEAASVLEEGDADLVVLGRALLADEDWIHKAQQGRDDEIVPCLRCGSCMHWTTDRRDHGCSVNPHYRNDSWMPSEDRPVKTAQRVVVIGGGPAGMKAALTAAKRGHHVTLLEQNTRLGGALTILDQAAHKADLRRYRDYLISQIEKSTVTVMLNTKATRESIAAMKPDHLILALGGKPRIPAIPGIERGWTYAQMDCHEVPKGTSVLILGGGAVGCELALSYCEAGCSVTLVEPGEQLHRSENQLVGLALDEHLKHCENLRIRLNTRCLEIKADSAVIEQEGIVQTIPAAVVIICTGVTPLSQDADSFYGLTAHTWKIGDVRRPSKIKDATFDGWIAGNQD